MIRIAINCGIGRNRRGEIITTSTRNAARAKIVEQANAMFGGVTISESYGSWVDSSGQSIIEPGWIIQALTGGSENAERFAVFVRDVLEQSSVVLSVETIDARFI